MQYEDFKKLDKAAAIKAAAAYVGVEPSIIDGLWATESGRGSNKGPSVAGAQGDFQIMPKTQARLEAKLRRKFTAGDFHDSLFMAAAHLKDDLIREGGDLRNALRAYNNGPKWRNQEDPRGENAAYADKVFRAAGLAAPATAAAPAALEAPQLTLQTTQLPLGDSLGKAPRASKLLDELEAFDRSRIQTPLVDTPLSNDPLVRANADALAETKLKDETSFIDQIRAAIPQQMITGAIIRRVHESDYAPTPGYVVDPRELEGHTLDEQQEILDDGGASREATAQVKGRIMMRRDAQEVIGRHGGWQAFGAQLLAGLPEAVLTGGAVSVGFRLAGRGAYSLAEQGRRGAAAVSAVAENVGGNVLAAAIEDVIGGQLHGHDYVLAATLGLAVSPLQIKGSWAAGTAAELSRQRDAALAHAVEQSERLYNTATARLGPTATADQIRAEMVRLEAEPVRATINDAIGSVAKDRRLLPEELANPFDADEAVPVVATAAKAASPEGNYTPDIMRLFEEEGLVDPVSRNITDPTKVVIGQIGMMRPDHMLTGEAALANAKLPVNRPIIERYLGTSIEKAQELKPGVYKRDNVDPAVEKTINWLQKTFLPHVAIVLRNEAVISKADHMAEHLRAFPGVHVVAVRHGNGGVAAAIHEVGHAILVDRLPHLSPAGYKGLKEFHRKWVALYKGAADSPDPKLKGRQVAALLRSPLQEASNLPSIGKGVKEPLGQEASLFDVLARNVGLDGRPTKYPDARAVRDAKEYWPNFDEMSAEQFGKYIEASVADALPGVKLDVPSDVLQWFKEVWSRLLSLFTYSKANGYIKPDESFVQFFEGVRASAARYNATAPKVVAESRTAAEPVPVTATAMASPAQTLASDPLATKHGFNLMPAGTVQEASEAKAVRSLWDRATAEGADWNSTDYDKRLSRLLKNNTFSNTSSSMLRSKNPVMRMIAYELLENPAGAAGRRSNAALAKHINERVIMGNAINDLQMQYAKYRSVNGGNVAGDLFNGKLWEQFNREVAAEIEARRGNTTGNESEAVRLAADSLEAAYERARVMQADAKTIGWGALPESSRGYMPHKMSAAKLRNLPRRQKEALHSALVDQFQSIEGFDAAFSTQLASKYLDRIERRAVGDFAAPINVHNVGAADVVEDALTAMGMSRPEVLAAMKRYMRGGPSHTKSRLKLDLLAQHAADDGSTFRLIDLFETNQISLLRSQAQRVSGEVALAKQGIMGRPGLDILRRAASFGDDAAKATDLELQALDQVSAEFLGAPFGSVTGKFADRAVQATALSRLGGMGFTQFAEYINGIVPLGVTRVMASVAGMPRLIGEARRLARGEKVDNPVLSSLELGAAEFGTDSYKLVFPFDNPDLQYQVYGADSVTFIDRALRAGSHLQGKLSFWRAIHSAQQRGMAEQIVLKSVRFIRDGTSSKALADMGFTPELNAKLRAQLNEFVKFEGGRVASLDVTKLDKDTANEFIQAVHRGSSQIIQGTFIGETGPWVHNSMLRLLTQFRTFSITSIEKQWGRNQNNYGVTAAFGMLMGSMALAAPIYIARVHAMSMLRDDREEFLAEQLSPERVARATMNYVAASGLTGDFLDAVSTVTGLGKSTGGRAGHSTEFVGNVVAPAAGLANDAWKALQNTKEGTDVHELAKHLPFSKVPILGIAINSLD